jgi:hypothetical protein
MRVDAVNSYLSSIPAMEMYPVAAVKRHAGSNEDRAQDVTTARVTPQANPFVDTMSKAQMPYDLLPTPKPIAVQIDAVEMKQLEAYINSMRHQTAHLLHSFPALLKA